jgi:hypothetical protein
LEQQYQQQQQHLVEQQLRLHLPLAQRPAHLPLVAASVHLPLAAVLRRLQHLLLLLHPAVVHSVGPRNPVVGSVVLLAHPLAVRPQQQLPLQLPVQQLQAAVCLQGFPVASQPQLLQVVLLLLPSQLLVCLPCLWMLSSGPRSLQLCQVSFLGARGYV